MLRTLRPFYNQNRLILQGGVHKMPRQFLFFSDLFPFVDYSFRARCFGILGIARFMYWSKSGTVNAVSPCCGLKIIPFRIRPLLSGAIVSTLTPSLSATSPDLWGPGPSSAIARR